jgi:hypothetical protein
MDKLGGDQLKEKMIYDNGNSKLTVKFDGELIALKQEIYGIDIINDIHIYVDELEEIVKFIHKNI